MWTFQLRENFAVLQRSTPDFFHFRVDGLSRLRDRFGGDSVELRDGVALLEELIVWITEAYRDMYTDNVIIGVLAYKPNGNKSQMSDGRKGRRLLQTTASSDAVSRPCRSWYYNGC